LAAFAYGVLFQPIHPLLWSWEEAEAAIVAAFTDVLGVRLEVIREERERRAARIAERVPQRPDTGTRLPGGHPIRHVINVMVSRPEPAVSWAFDHVGVTSHGLSRSQSASSA
jgi:hypothetical protein